MNEDNVIVTAVALKKDQKLVVQDNNSLKDIPYIKIGSGKSGKYGDSMNLIQEMAKMTKPEQVMFGLLEEELDYWDEQSFNRVKLNSKNLNSTQKQYIKKAYPLLYEKGLIARVSRGIYMVNPSLILAKKHIEATKYWNQICKEEFKIKNNNN